MATLASVFSFFTFQVLALMTLTEADLQIEVRPSEIVLGTTSSLDINCSFSLTHHPEMAAFASLILSRTQGSGDAVEDLAAITQFSPDLATVLTQEKVSATGVHSQTGESFLQVTWDHPTASQAGIYQCVAHGLDILGQTVEAANSSEVTATEANLNDVFEKLEQMELHETAMENMMADMKIHMQALELNNSMMSSYITDLENTVASLQQLQLMSLIGTYKNHDYYVCREPFININNSIDTCKSVEGQLVEVDDEDEFLAIQSFLNYTLTTSLFYNHPSYMIAGTDDAAEDSWVLQSTNQPLPYISWANGEPNGGTDNNCLNFYFHDGTWNMADCQCQLPSPAPGLLCMCEVEIA